MKVTGFIYVVSSTDDMNDYGPVCQSAAEAEELFRSLITEDPDKEIYIRGLPRYKALL
jgi:hypothetical protein